jgi:hypothetical protein
MSIFQGQWEPHELRGIIPRAFCHIFERIEGTHDQNFLVAIHREPLSLSLSLSLSLFLPPPPPSLSLSEKGSSYKLAGNAVRDEP